MQINMIETVWNYFVCKWI